MIRQDLQNRKWQQKRKRGKVYMPSPLLVEELFVMLVEYVSTIFSNEGFEDDNGYRVYSCKVIEPDEKCKPDDLITITGKNIPKANGLRYVLEGNWKNSKHGLQYNVSSFEELIQPNYKGIVGFLSSGRIKGVNPAIAERIYHMFRQETINVLDENPERLRDVPGISTEKLNCIIDSYRTERFFKKLLTKYKKYKVNMKILARVCSVYGDTTEEVLDEDPYILTEFGVNIKNIIEAANVPADHIGKAKAVILESIKEAEGLNGDTYILDSVYVKYVQKNARKYHVTREALSKAEEKLCDENKIIYMDDGVSRQLPYDVESDCARELLRIVKHFIPDDTIDYDEEIRKAEAHLHCSLHVMQREAVKQALQNGVTLVTGGPGTGKTTVVKVMRHILENVLHKDVIFMAPTGRAAARMKESSGYPAFTAHKQLKILDENLFEKQPFSIEESCSVCDETSMVDIYVARRILQAIKNGNQIIFLGDVEQLPSVGPGAFFKDMIDSGYITTVCLTKVFRQASNSNIYLNCRKIVKGNLSLEYGDDFVLLYAYEQEEAAEIMADVFINEVNTFGIENVCCLTPLRQKTPTGAFAMNKRIQSIINPASDDKPEIYHFPTHTVYRLGDRVMSKRNTDKTCNGDLGFITEITRSNVKVHFAECDVNYAYDELDDITLAYCMTIHKSQGSEFKSVISTMLESHGEMLQMNLFNTAVSRAKVRYVCVGNKEAINMAILNREGIMRNTKVCEKIITLFEHYEGVA